MLKVNGQDFKTTAEAARHFGVRGSTFRNWKLEAQKSKRKVVKKVNLVIEVK